MHQILLSIIFIFLFFMKKKETELIYKNNKIEREEELEKFPQKIQVNKLAIFIDYDHENASKKLSDICNLDLDQRITYVKHISMILNELGAESINLLKKLFDDIMKDTDDLKRQLLYQVPQIIKFLEKHQNSYNNISIYIIPLLISFLQMPILAIKQQAAKYLCQISHKLNQNDRGRCILKYVIQMAHDSNEENRVVAVQLFSMMSEDFGRDLCQQYIGLQFLSLGQDSSIKVRKQTILNLPKISKQVSANFFKIRFFKFFQKKALQKNPQIKKSCVQIISQLMCFCDNSMIQSQVDIYLSFFRDQNKLLKSNAYKNLGHFIASLKGRTINQKLIDAFTKMVTKQINDINSQYQISYACAYDFPAVVDAVGPDKWTKLYPTYQKLLKIQDKKIKKSLSSSLYEIAKVIGEKHTRNHLFVILDDFLKDKNDQIKFGAIQHLAQILKILDQKKRQQLIDIFLSLQKDPKKWRIRQLIARQFTLLSQIYDLQKVFMYIVPIAFKFCSDTVSIVREEAAKRIGDIFQKFYKKKQASQLYLTAIIENIKGFSISKKFSQRQAFLLMCQKLLNFKEIFQQHFLETFVELSRDKVVNVRIIVVEILIRHLQSKGPMSQNPTILRIIQQLKKDSNEEISQLLI